jgi:hypothetical protein
MVNRLMQLQSSAQVLRLDPGPGEPFYVARSIVVDPEAVKYVALEMLQEAGVDMLLHTVVSDVLMEGSTLRGLMVESKSGRMAIPAKQVVDCTGDGDVAARAGAPFEKGRPQDGIMQPLTLIFIMANVDIEKGIKAGVVRWRSRKVEGPEPWKSRYGSYYVHLNRWADELDQQFPQYEGTLRRFHAWSLGNGILYGGNLIHVSNVDGTDAQDISRGEAQARMLVWRLCRFLRACAPGFEEATIVSTASRVGVRETRRILGEHYLTLDDVLQARKFDDVVALCGYFVDIHDYSGGPEFHEPTKGHLVKEDQDYEIPYRCLVPQVIDNLLVSGRCISSSHEAQASLRVMGTAMALGQAAGVAAAIAAPGSHLRQVKVLP